MWWQHHLGQRHHLLAILPGGVPKLGRLLLADHRCSGLWHQAQLYPAASSRAARLHHRLVRHRLCIILPALRQKVNCSLGKISNQVFIASPFVNVLMQFHFPNIETFAILSLQRAIQPFVGSHLH